MVLSFDRPQPNPFHSDLLRGVAEATSQLLTSSDYTQAIDSALAILGQVTGVDRVYIFAVHPHPETGEPASSQKFEWVRESVTPQINNPALQNRTYATSGLARWYELLQAGESFSAIVRELPASERQTLIIQDIQAILIVPILIKGMLWGLIGFDDCHQERRWSPDEEAVLQTMAASLGGAIARQQAEDALYDSQTRLHTIAANVPGLIYQFRLNADGSRRVVYASSGSIDLLELEPTEVQQNFCLISDLCHPDDRTSFEESIADSAKSLTSWNWQGRIITPSGKLKWVQGFSRPERLSNGDVLWNGVLVDITDRKRVEEEYRQSEARYRAMLDASPDLMFRLSPTGQYLDFKGNGVTPIPREAIVGKFLQDLLPEDVAERSLQAVRHTLESGELQTCEYQLPNPMGVIRDYEARLVVSDENEVLSVVRDVTVAKHREAERKRVEADLRASEERLQSFFNATFEAVVIHDFDVIVDVNPAAEAMFGYSCSEMIGMPVLNLTAPEQREQVSQQWRSLTNPKQPYVYEGIGIRKDGVTFMTAVSAKAIEYRGRLLRVASIRDITERKCAEAALRLSEEKFSKAFRCNPNPMSIATVREGRIIEVNDSFLKTTGYEKTELIGRTVNEFGLWANPADRASVIEPLQQTGTVCSLECLFRKKSGEVFTCLLSAELIEIAGESCILDVAVDITDRKRDEAERKKVQQQLWAAAERDRLLGQIALRIRQSLNLEQILNTTVTEVRQYLKADRVHIGHNDEMGRAIIVAESVDPHWRSLLGYTIQNPEHLQELRELFADGQAWVVEDTTKEVTYPAIAAYYSEYHVRATLAVPIVVDDRIFGLLVAHQCATPRSWQPDEVDLLSQLANQVSIAVQQAQLYRKVQDLNTGLEKQVAERTAQLQQKMEELQELNDLKDEFLNAFSHDLKTPVMGISLVISNLLNQPGETIPINRSILERMVQSSNHQLHLINSLLEAHSSETRGVALQYELVQLSLLTQVIVEDLEPLVTKNQATLVNHVPPDLPLVNADPVQLRRVFENLITNALNHNPPGIKIAIDATIESEMIRFTIQDTGVGISQEVRDRLFERYTRGIQSRHSRGIGLGLYLCRQIITAHGGQIGVNSIPGQGSTFWLTLPLAIPSVLNPNPAAIAEA